MNRILIVDDEAPIARMICLCLTKNGYACDTALNGTDATRLAEENHYDLALVDIMLPDINGYELLVYLRQFHIPVLFVTAKATVPDTVKGLRAGADDYITKPFDLNELLARVEAALRRQHKTETDFTVGSLSVDTLSRRVSRQGEDVPLTAKEFDLLLFFVRNQGVALYRERIFEEVWQEPYYGGTRTIDLHVQRLKKKLKLGNAIEAIYTVGYIFRPEKMP